MIMPAHSPDAGIPPGAPGPEWIVCHGAARSVLDGVVVCPEGWLSPWRRCLDCRNFEASDDDRDRECSCSDQATVTAEDGTEQPLERWAALVIELL
jgi:hypothetical protein